MKYVLVVYSYSKKEYRRVIGEQTENHNKLCKAMLGLDMQLGDDYFSIIEEVQNDWFPPNPINHICHLHSK